MRCGECGCKELVVKSAIGKGFAYMQYPKVILTVDLDLLSCTKCDNVILKSGDFKNLDKAIEDSLDKLTDEEKTLLAK